MSEPVTLSNIDDKGYEEGTMHGYLGAVMRRNGKRFWAGDNISDYVSEEDIPRLIDEATVALLWVLVHLRRHF
mgnify:FL=1